MEAWLFAEGRKTDTENRAMWIEEKVPQLSYQSNGKRHWFLTHRHDKPSLDQCGGRCTHRCPLTKQSCSLTSASSNTAKAPVWVHKSENTHTYRDSRRWEITALPSLQQNSDSISSHPSSHHPLCLPSCWITNTLHRCSGKQTERKGLTFFFLSLSVL